MRELRIYEQNGTRASYTRRKNAEVCLPVFLNFHSVVGISIFSKVDTIRLV